MINTTMNRRKLLKSVGSASVAAPFINLLNSQAAFAAGTAERIIFVYHPDGCTPADWHPNQTSGSISGLSQALAPLDNFKDQLVLFRNLNIGDGNGDGHEDPFRALWTGYDSGGGSVDTHIANTFGHDLIHLGVKSAFQSGGFTTYYNGGGGQKQPIDDPYTAYEQFLANAQPSTGDGNNQNDEEAAAAAADVARLEATLADIDFLMSRSSTEEQNKLNIHKTALERKLSEAEAANTGTVGGEIIVDPASCSKYDINAYGFDRNDVNNDKAIPTIFDMQARTLVHAMACGVSRVGSIQISTHTSKMIMDYPGVMLEQGMWAKESHEASHNMADIHTSMKVWFNTKVAELLDLLQRTPEPTSRGGTMLDNTLVFVTTEVNSGPQHTRNDMPFYIAGGKGSGAINTGIVFDAGGQPHARVLSALSTAVGAGGFADSPIAGLLT